FTFQERRGPIQGKVVTFIGDGACNMPMSWIFAAIKLGFELRIAAPAKYQPTVKLERLRMTAGSAGDGPAKAEGNRWATWNFKDAGRIVCTDDVETAASGADLLYTDVWVSMGK